MERAWGYSNEDVGSRWRYESQSSGPSVLAYAVSVAYDSSMAIRNLHWGLFCSCDVCEAGFGSVVPMEMDSTAKHLDVCSRNLNWGFGFCGPCPSTDTCGGLCWNRDSGHWYPLLYMNEEYAAPTRRLVLSAGASLARLLDCCRWLPRYHLRRRCWRLGCGEDRISTVSGSNSTRSVLRRRPFGLL